MKSIALVSCVVMVLVGAYASRRYQLETTVADDQEVLSEQVEERNEISEAPSESPSIAQAPSKSPTSTPQINPSQISDLIYPGANVMQKSDSSATLESRDDTDKITDWYKAKIEAMGMNVKSFVKTKANDKVLNKLAAANASKEINVEISKESGGSAVIIKVTVENN